MLRRSCMLRGAIFSISGCGSVPLGKPEQNPIRFTSRAWELIAQSKTLQRWTARLKPKQCSCLRCCCHCCCCLFLLIFVVVVGFTYRAWELTAQSQTHQRCTTRLKLISHCLRCRCLCFRCLYCCCLRFCCLHCCCLHCRCWIHFQGVRINRSIPNTPMLDWTARLKPISHCLHWFCHCCRSICCCFLFVFVFLVVVGFTSRVWELIAQSQTHHHCTGRRGWNSNHVVFVVVVFLVVFGFTSRAWELIAQSQTHQHCTGRQGGNQFFCQCSYNRESWVQSSNIMCQRLTMRSKVIGKIG